MPYTWGLLSSIPRLDRERPEQLVGIRGTPPDMTAPPSGCRFAPRCSFAREICNERVPDLLPMVPAGSDHRARGWGTADVVEGGWLRGIDWYAAQEEANKEADVADLDGPLSSNEEPPSEAQE